MQTNEQHIAIDFERASPEDFRKSLELLREYTVKLKNACEAKLEFRASRVRFFASGTLTSLVGSLGVGWLTLVNEEYLRMLFKVDEYDNFMFFNQPSILVLFLFIIFFGFCVWVLYFGRIYNQRTARSSHYEARQLRKIIVVLVKTLSQYRDHAKNRISDHFEFDLRIAEAEAALDFFDSVFYEVNAYEENSRKRSVEDTHTQN